METLQIEGREVFAEVPITLITIRQAGHFLPGVKDIISRVIDRSERNVNHLATGMVTGGVRVDDTPEKTLIHTGIEIKVNAWVNGRTVAALIGLLGLEGQVIEISGDKKGYKKQRKIELRSTLQPDKRLKAQGWLTLEDLEVLKANLANEIIRLGRIWINPIVAEDGKIFWVANIMLGAFDPWKPEYADLPEFLLPITDDYKIDVKELIASSQKVAA